MIGACISAIERSIGIPLLATLLFVLFHPQAGFATPQRGEAWDLFDFPEFVVNGYLHQDVAVGPVAHHKAVGFDSRTATQLDTGMQPTGTDHSGVAFSGNGQFLEFPMVKDALAGYRWTLIVFRVDGSSSDAATDLLNVNAIAEHGNLPGSQMPVVVFQPETNTIAALWRGRAPDGPRYYSVNNASVVADGKTWNVALVYRRHGRLFLNVNGAEAKTPFPPTLSFSAPLPQNDAVSLIGDPQKGTARWAYDTIVFGQSELTEPMVEKIEAWALWKMNHQSLLPASHPYRSEPPKVDEEDFPHRYIFSSDHWAALWDRNTVALRNAFNGEPLPEPQGYERVFFDDFRANLVADSTASEGGEAAAWYAPGHNGNVGRLAELYEPRMAPQLYLHDSEAQTLTLSLRYDESWQGAAMYSVNDAGLGRSWKGGGIFRVRVKFPNIEGNPGVGYFPAAPWFYNLEHLFWRTSERIEFDGFEFEGVDDRWINGGSSHVHAGRYPGLFGNLAEDAPAMEIFNDQAWIDVWDGKFHIWEVRIQEEITILGVDGLEIARVETPPEYLDRLYMILNVAAKRGAPEPDRERHHEMTIDYVEVLQSADKLANVQPPFLKRPTIWGAPKVGSVLTCDARLAPGFDDIWYFWYADGYPLGFGVSPTLRVAREHVGSRLKCMVRASGALNVPEAWTLPTDHVVMYP